MINLGVIFRDDCPDGDKSSLHKRYAKKKKKRKPKDSEVNSKLINAVNLHVSFKKLKKEKQRVF